MTKYYTGSGRIINIGRQMGMPGAEGTVFSILGQPNMVVKIYHDSELNRMRQEKLHSMVANKPRKYTMLDKRSGRHVPVLAWPEDIVMRSRSGQVCGFTMKAVDVEQAVEIHNIESAFARDARPWTKDLGLGLRAHIARNLCFLVNQIHSAGAIIGDFNERNVLVSQNLIVCMIDCDSMQIRDSSKYYPCTMLQPGFIAPELLGKDLSRTIRHASSDYFSLAVHIYCLLLDRHPFRNGVYTGPGEKPPNHILAKQGQWRGRSGGILKIEPSQIDPRILLPRSMMLLFEKAFQKGAKDPSIRPSVREWEAELRNFIGGWKSNM